MKKSKKNIKYSHIVTAIIGFVALIWAALSLGLNSGRLLGFFVALFFIIATIILSRLRDKNSQKSNLILGISICILIAYLIASFFNWLLSSPMNGPIL